MERQYHLYILEDSDDEPSEIQAFISLFFQKFNCHPHNRSRRFNVYLPRNDDIAGWTRFENANNAIKNSEMILCIISPWNTHWIDFCRQAALYQKIMNNMRDKFIPVFLGYDSVREANRACPEEIQCQTAVVFNMSWREDENAWERLGRSIGQPIEPVGPETHGGPPTGLAIQCTDDNEHDQNMNNLWADGPSSPFPLPSPNIKICSSVTGILETSTPDGRERAVVPTQVSRPLHNSSPCDQTVHIRGSIPDGPGPLSLSRPGGLFPNNSDTSSIRHPVSPDTNRGCEENASRCLSSEVTVDIDLGGQSEPAAGLTDRTNPKLVWGDSLRSEELVGGHDHPERLSSDVTDDIEDEINDADGSLDSGHFTSAEQSDYNVEVQMQQNGADVKQNGAEVQKPKAEMQKNRIKVQKSGLEVQNNWSQMQKNRAEVKKSRKEVQKNGVEVQKNQADVKQSEPQLKQNETDDEKVDGDNCHCESTMGVPNDPSESCGQWARCPDGSDHQEHSPMLEGEAIRDEESGLSVLTPTHNAAILRDTAQVMLWAISGLWEVIQYY